MGLTIRWDITSKCNMKCAHCAGYESTDIKEELRLDQVLNVIDMLSKEKIDCIKLLGGEPLLRNDLPQIIQRLYQLEIPVGITTNGVTPISDELISCIQQNMLKYITISLDSNIDAINQILRCGSSMDVIDQTISFLVNTKEKYNLSTGFAINCVLNRCNYSYVSSLIQYAANKHIDKIAFMCLAPRGRAKTLSNIICEPQELINASVDIAKEYSKFENNPIIIEPSYAPALMPDYIARKFGLLFPSTEYTCKATTNLGYIDCEGKLHPCETVAHYYPVSNNDLNENAFRTIWNSSTFDAIYSSIERAESFKPICHNCKYGKRHCYPCPNWSLKPEICHLIVQEFPDLFETENEN